MKLTKDQIKKTSQLANLELNDSDISKYLTQLSKILEYVDKLNEVNTKDIEPTYNVSGLKNVLAKDTDLELGITQEEALKNSENKKDGYFVAKGVNVNE